MSGGRPAPSRAAALLTLAGAIGAWWAVAMIHVAGRPLVATPAATLGALSRTAPTLARASRVDIFIWQLRHDRRRAVLRTDWQQGAG